MMHLYGEVPRLSGTRMQALPASAKIMPTGSAISAGLILKNAAMVAFFGEGNWKTTRVLDDMLYR